MSQEFNFDIDKIANNAISKSDKTTEIIEANTTQENGQLTFLEKLTPEQQSAITAKAPQLVDNFVSDQNALLDFGQSAVEEVNGTVNRILAEQKKLQIPQVDELLKNTNTELNGFVAKYKDAQVAELDKKPNFLENSSNRAKTLFKNSILIHKILSKKWIVWLPLSSSKKICSHAISFLLKC